MTGPADDPIRLFHQWQAEARGLFTGRQPVRAALLGLAHKMAYRAIRRFAGTGELPYANVAALATASATSRPSVRMVLLKEASEEGFVFYTDYRSRKAIELEQNSWAAMALYFPIPPRQVRVEGPVLVLERPRSRRYWQSRPRGSQLSATASTQSAELDHRASLVARVSQLREQYRRRPVPLPAHWGGYRLVPKRIEFWRGRDDRLHERVCYVRDEGARRGWSWHQLQP